MSDINERLRTAGRVSGGRKPLVSLGKAYRRQRDKRLMQAVVKKCMERQFRRELGM